MSLNYLEFDYSEDTEGVGVFDAMASVGTGHVPALQAEVAKVLGWAYDVFPQGRGPLDEGFDWDYDLQARVESSTPESWVFEPTSGLVLASRGQPGEPLCTVTLSLSGTEAFCQALRERFDLG